MDIIMEKQDLRIRRTYKLLRNALIELIQEKPFDKISVTDICDRAMVHRATFYSHFEDKYRLLDYCVWGFFSIFDEVPISSYTFEGYKDYFLDVARKILIHMEDNRDIYMAFLKQNSATFEHILTANIYEKMCEKFDNCIEHGIKMTIPKEIFASFYSGACANMVLWWIKNDMPMNSEELVKYIAMFVRNFEKE